MEKTSTSCGKCSRSAKATGDFEPSEESWFSLEQEEAGFRGEVEDKGDFAGD